MRHPEIPVVYAKRKLPADVRKLKNDCEARGKRTRRARSVAAVRQALLPRALRLIRPGSNIFSLVRPSPLFFFPLSPIGRTRLRALVMPYPDAVIWSSRTPMRDPGIPAFVIPHIDVESRKYRQKHLQNTLPLRPLSGPRIACGVTPFVIPHSDVVSRNIRGGSHCCYSSYAMNWTPHHVRGDVPGYAAPRRSIQEIEAREYSLSMRLEYST